MVENQFKECELDESLYYKHVQVGSEQSIVIVSTYVDDIYVFSLHPHLMVDTLYSISQKFRTTKAECLCGLPDYFFGDRDSLSQEEQSKLDLFKYVPKERRWAVADKEHSLSYVSIEIYFSECGEYVILDQSKFIEKSHQKLLQKGVISESDEMNVHELKPDHFSHLHLNQEVDGNELLSGSDLQKLRAGVNTLSYYGLNTGYPIMAALGSIARGQSAGRSRHLKSLRILIQYTFQNLV